MPIIAAVWSNPNQVSKSRNVSALHLRCDNAPHIMQCRSPHRTHEPTSNATKVPSRCTVPYEYLRCGYLPWPLPHVPYMPYRLCQLHQPISSLLPVAIHTYGYALPLSQNGKPCCECLTQVSDFKGPFLGPGKVSTPRMLWVCSPLAWAVGGVLGSVLETQTGCVVDSLSLDLEEV